MGRISDTDVQRVRDATDLVAVVTETVPLRQKGRLFWGLCPFHGEKTPSFKVDPATQLWHCFGCGLGGDVFGFVMRSQNMEFPDVVRMLADRAHIDIVEEGGPGLPQGRRERLIAACEAAAGYYHKSLTASTTSGARVAREYLSGRGFGSPVAKRWMLGYAPTGGGGLVSHLTSAGFSHEEIVEANLGMVDSGGRLKDRFFDRVMFPISDLTGRVIAFGGRIIREGQPKYLNSADTPVFHKSANMYAIDRAKSAIVSTGTAIVVEGYTDVIALHEAGLTNAVATLGTALTARHVKLLGRFAKRVVYLFDGDEAGLRAADRAAEFLDFFSTPEAGSARLDLLVAIVPEGRDPADHVAACGADSLREIVDGAQPLLRFVVDRRLDAFDLSSPEGRARALGAAAEVLASVRGSILAQDYANHVAGRLMTDYATVKAAADAARPAFDGKGRAGEEDAGRVVPPRERSDGRVLAERELLRQVVAAPRLRDRVRDLLAMADAVSDPTVGRALAQVMSAGDVTGQALYDAVAARDRDAAAALTTYLVDPLTAEEAIERFEETYARLAAFALKAEILRVQGEMRTADTVKDPRRGDELFRRVAELQQAVEELKAGGSPDLRRFRAHKGDM